MHAVMSEWERDQISERTKAALAAKKARGEWVGSRVITEQVNAARIEQARSFATTLHTTLRAYCSGGMTVSQMCEELNARGIKSARDGAWQPTQLRRTLERLDLRTARTHKAPAVQAGEASAQWMG
jgi:DNA invertase Pin-like site-specific DNA recombinase